MKSFHGILVVILLFLVSCSSDRPAGKTQAQILFKEAQRFVKNSRYILATQKLNDLRSKYPYSYYATHAELLLADVQFEQESYAQAAASYILFRDFHPKHERSDYVLFKIAESFYNQLPSTYDRDLSSANEAIRYYGELLRNFPQSKLIKSAKKKISYCKKMIRNKEQYIADFYFKTKVYQAARYRYLNILKKFREPKVIAHSAVRVLESTGRLNERNACRGYYKSLRARLGVRGNKSLKQALDTCLK